MLPILGMFIIFLIFIIDKGYLDFVQVTSIGTALCLVGFFLTGRISSKVLSKVRDGAILNEYMRLKKYPAASRDEIEAHIVQKETSEIGPANISGEEDLSLPTTLGTTGIYAIVIGLGISDALAKFVEKTTGPTGTIASYFANNTFINQTIGNLTNSTNYPLIGYNIAPLFLLNLSEVFRLSGFLFTIIPFIHGTILMFSKQWYRDTKEETHYFVALLFFIMVFIITIMYFFVGLNIMDTAFFIFSLWFVMAFNSVWLVVYSKIIKRTLKKQYLVRREWVLLNLNTLAFLSIFLFASPNLLSINEIVGNNIYLNFLVVIILFGRIVTDYIISWDDFYLGTIKLPKNTPPGQVTGLQIVPNKGPPSRMDLTWTANIESDLHHYNIYRGNQANFTVTLSTPDFTSQTNTYSDSPVVANNIYYYRIAVVNTSNTIRQLSVEVSAQAI